jgi:uncharacterized repeat protein (TIGR04076 family)
MAVKYPSIGNKVKAKVLGMEKPCTINMQKGDEFELSIHKCGEFCGLFYHNIQPFVVMMQTGGDFPGLPDPDVMPMIQCPNGQNKVKIELKRVKA